MTYSFLRLATLLMLSFALLFYSAESKAGVRCSATMNPVTVTFADISGTPPTDVTATVNVSCTTDGFEGYLSSMTSIRACLSLGAYPRQLTRVGGTEQITYETYGPTNALMQPAVAMPVAAQQINIQYSYGPLWVGGSGGGSYTIRFRIPNVAGLAAGDYAQSVADVHTQLDFRWNTSSTYPSSCKSGGSAGDGGTFPFTVKAKVLASCSINPTTNLDFGSFPGIMTAPVDQTTAVGVICSSQAPYRIALGLGDNPSGAKRRMKNASGDFLEYGLYRDAARSLNWGSTVGTDTVSAVGSGNAQTATVFGRVPVQDAAIGTYSDTVTVTVSW